MFIVDKSQNRIKKIEKQTFADIGMKERPNLQEWLAHQPDALGEELLIIQKEFAGFENTKERLDLLALDKEGNLVVIENKLDDSGSDVTWQALKYTAYASTLSKQQIIDIYQEYLTQYCQGGNAEEMLCIFFDVEDLEEITLNSGNDQRIMLVAAGFRPEVTATALWLRRRSIDVRCIKVNPFLLERGEIIVDITQIIPVPEASDYEISMSSKEDEERGMRKSQQRCYEFWQETLKVFRDKNVELFQNRKTPSRDPWLTAGAGISGCYYCLHILKAKVRVTLEIRGDENQIKQRYENLLAQRADLENTFGTELQWQSRDGNRQCKISFSEEIDGYNRKNWPYMINWLAEHIQRLEAAFKDPILELKNLPPPNDAEQDSGSNSDA